MRTTLNIDDAILKRARQLTGIEEKTALVRMGLEALVARKSAQRLASLGGTEKHARAVPSPEIQIVILVDTSVWINHLRTHSKLLTQLLDLEQVLVHPFVIGEIACGNLTNRKEIISLLLSLPSAPKADDDEVLFFVEQHNLMGCGLGLVDVHLLTSAMIEAARIWTADRSLALAARKLSIEFDQNLTAG